MAEVIVHLEGGLGNQLFIWAAGYSLSRSLDARLIVEHDYRPGGSRTLEIDGFDHAAVLVRQRKTKRARSSWLGRLTARRGGAAYLPDDVNQLTSLPSARRIIVEGLFQDLAYFQAYTAEIRSRVARLRSPSSWYRETTQSLAESGPFTALHIRRGDYLHLPDFGVLPSAYYHRAISCVVDKQSEPRPLVVFSDELSPPAWLETLKWPGKLTMVRPPGHSRPLESLLLMSEAQNLITANSTFSWWAGFIGNPSLVIHPSPRFRNDRIIGPSPLHFWVAEASWQ